MKTMIEEELRMVHWLILIALIFIILGGLGLYSKLRELKLEMSIVAGANMTDVRNLLKEHARLILESNNKTQILIESHDGDDCTVAVSAVHPEECCQGCRRYDNCWSDPMDE